MNGTDLPIRDIHLPDSSLWWPLAPGWWLLILLTLFITGLIYQKRKRNALHPLAKNTKKTLSEAHALLTSIATKHGSSKKENSGQQTIKALSVLLRRTAISLYGDESVAGLAGEKWLEFLDDKGNTKNFSQGMGHLFLDLPYRPKQPVNPSNSTEEHNNKELDSLLLITQQWLNAQAHTGNTKGNKEESHHV